MKKMLCVLALTLPLCGTLVTAPITAAHADRRGENRTTIRLTGPAINGVRPQGNAEYRVRSDRRRFKAEASNVNLPDGTVLTVKVNDTVVGTLRLLAGRGELELNTQDGANPPSIVVNDMVSIVTAEGVVVVRGKF